MRDRSLGFDVSFSLFSFFFLLTVILKYGHSLSSSHFESFFCCFLTVLCYFGMKFAIQEILWLELSSVILLHLNMSVYIYYFIKSKSLSDVRNTIILYTTEE